MNLSAKNHALDDSTYDKVQLDRIYGVKQGLVKEDKAY